MITIIVKFSFYDTYMLFIYIMVIGLNGLQFGQQSYEWLTKLDDREVGILSITSMITDGIGRQEVLLSISESNKYI